MAYVLKCTCLEHHATVCMYSHSYTVDVLDMLDVLDGFLLTSACIDSSISNTVTMQSSVLGPPHLKAWPKVGASLCLGGQGLAR